MKNSMFNYNAGQLFEGRFTWTATTELDRTKVPFEARTKIRVRLEGTLLARDRVDILITIDTRPKLSLGKL